MKLLLAEDDMVLRDGLTRSLQQAGYAVDNARNGLDADHALSFQNYDLLILDLGLPKLDGFEVLRRFRAHNQATPVLILTAKDAVEDRVAGLDLGADDYLTKPVECEDLLAAIKSRLLRKYAHDDQTASELAATPVQPDFTTSTPLEQLGLTPREAEVLLWVAQGKSNSDIAIILRMAEATVKTHLGHVFEKLGVESRTAATLRAVEILSRPVLRQEALGNRRRP